MSRFFTEGCYTAAMLLTSKELINPAILITPLRYGNRAVNLGFKFSFQGHYENMSSRLKSHIREIEDYRCPIGNDFDVITKIRIAYECIVDYKLYRDKEDYTYRNGGIFFRLENTCKAIYEKGLLGDESPGELRHKWNDISDYYMFEDDFHEAIEESIINPYKLELKEKEDLIKGLHEYAWGRFRTVNKDRLLAKIASGTKLSKSEVEKYPEVIEAFEAYERLDMEIKHMSKN